MSSPIINHKKTFSNKIKLTLSNALKKFRQQPLKHLIFASIIIITIIKLGLMGPGFKHNDDENLYTTSGTALKYISEFKIDSAINSIFLTKGRPASSIINLVPNAIQYVTARIFNLYYYETKNNYPLFIYNFIIYCFILILFYKIAKFLLKDTLLSLLCVLIYCTLTNSYIYLRHAYPYDASLLILLYVLFKTFKYEKNESLTSFKSLLLGLISFFGFLVYPGYFTLFLVCFLFFFFNCLSKANIFKKTQYAFFYFLGSIICLFLFEVASRLGGRSLISDALTLSNTIDNGSFEESFSFIIKYLFSVEHINGIIIIIGLALFCFILLYNIRFYINNNKFSDKPIPQNKFIRINSDLLLLGSLIIVIFLAFASSGYFFHKMVFYGRLVHQYILFLIIFAVFSINYLLDKITKKKNLILFLISILFIIQFSVNFSTYKSLGYPRDIVWDLSKKYDLKKIKSVFEFDDQYSQVEAVMYHSRYFERKNLLPNNIIILNCFEYNCPYDFSEYHPYTPEKNYHLIAVKPHFLTFKAYQFEGYGIMERKNLEKINLQIKIYSD